MLDWQVAAVRRFNRFYTKQIGVLQEHLLSSPYSLTEARVIYELAHAEQSTATRLAAELGLDAGYLSRILSGFEKQGLIERVPSEADGRQSFLSLTPKGQKAFAPLNAGSQREVAAMLEPLSEGEVTRLLEAMRTIEHALSAQTAPKAPYLLRQHRPGDMGWVVRAHGLLYAREYGWNEQFEAFVAKIVADFIERYDPAFERCWIAEQDGANVGSVFVVKKSKHVAQLRMLIVEPKARGLGIGARLVDESTRFAQETGYRKMILWTNDVLHAARHIYEKAGFALAGEQRHHSFGRDLVGQTWELPLTRA